MGIEPGSICSGQNLQLDKKRKGDSLRKKTIDFKRRRNHDTNKNKQQEGKTYQSNVGLTLDKTSTPQQTNAATEVFNVSNVSDKNFTTYESAASEFTPRPTCPRHYSQ